MQYDLTGHMGGVMKSFGENAPGFAAVRQPITSGPNFPDLFVFSVYENNVHWSNYITQLFTTPQGQSLRNHMDMIMDCHISTWASSVVVTASE